MPNPNPVIAVAFDTVQLLQDEPPERATSTSAAQSEGLAISGRALARLGGLLRLELTELMHSAHGLAVLGRSIVETWITGHGALLLDSQGQDLLRRRSGALDAQLRAPSASEPGGRADAIVPTLVDIARALDRKMYGTVDPPRAFQRHVASFFDEIDIGHVEGTVGLFTQVAKPGDGHEDHVRVASWVVLFLAHDHYAAAGNPAAAAAARALFDRLRGATAEFYAQRRAASRSSSE